MRSSSPAPKSSRTAVATSPTTSSAAQPAAAAAVVVRLSDAIAWRRRERRRLPCRREAEQQSDEQRRRGAERDDARVEGQRHGRRQQLLRNQRRRGVQIAAPSASPRTPPIERQHQALGQQLADRRAAGPRPAPTGSPARASAPWRAPAAGWRRWRSRSAARSRRRRGTGATSARSSPPITASCSGSSADAAARVRLRELAREPVGRRAAMSASAALERHAGLQPSDRAAGRRRSAPAAARRCSDTIAQMLVRPSSCASSGTTPTTVYADAVEAHDAAPTIAGIRVEARSPERLAQHDDVGAAGDRPRAGTCGRQSARRRARRRSRR